MPNTINPIPRRLLTDRNPRHRQNYIKIIFLRQHIVDHFGSDKYTILSELDKILRKTARVRREIVA